MKEQTVTINDLHPQDKQFFYDFHRFPKEPKTKNNTLEKVITALTHEMALEHHRQGIFYMPTYKINSYGATTQDNTTDSLWASFSVLARFIEGEELSLSTSIKD